MHSVSVPTDIWTEFFSIVLIEAMSCGTPVVSADCPGPTEVVTSEVGVIIENGHRNTKEIFKSSIRKLIEDGDTREQMGEAARMYSMETFSVETVATQWIEVLGSA